MDLHKTPDGNSFTNYKTKRKMKNKLLIFLICIAISFVAAGQNSRMMRGRVVDSKGEPISGAAIYQKNSNLFIASTTIDGIFEINAGKGDNIVVETSEGYRKTVTVNDPA